MRDRHRRHADRLHLPIRIGQRVELGLQLGGLRGVEPATSDAALDERFHREQQLQQQTQPFVLVALHARRQQVRVLCVEPGCEQAWVPGDVFARGGGPGGAPFGAEVVLDGVGDGHEDAEGAFDVGAFGGVEGGVVVAGAGEDGAGDVADAGDDYAEVIAAVPEAVVGCLVAEDEHEADDYGEGGDLESGCEGM